MNFKICNSCGKVTNLFGDVKDTCICGGTLREAKETEKYKIANKMAKSGRNECVFVASVPVRDSLTI